MKKQFIILTTILPTILVGCGNKVNTSFDDFTNNLFVQNICENTINLHYSLCDPAKYDIGNYNITLGSLSLDSQADALHECISDLEKYDYDSLNTSDQLNYDVIYDSLTTDLAMCDYELYTEMLSPSNGTQAQLPVLLAEYNFQTAEDVDNYLKLLKDMPRYFNEIINFEKNKAAAGLFMSDDLCNEVINQCEQFIFHPSDNILINTFNNKIKSVNTLNESDVENYIRKNTDAVYNYVIPAYKNLISELSLLLGSGTNELGLYYYDEGCCYYENLVYKTCGCNDSIDKIFDSIEFQRQKDLSACAQLLSQNPDIISECEDADNAFIVSFEESKSASPESAPSDTSYAVSEYSYETDTAIENKMISNLQNSIIDDFPSIQSENINYELSYVDESLQDSLAPAFYLTAPIDNYSNNQIYINPSCQYKGIELFTTLAHEGYPGHLYQTVKSYEYGLLPLRCILNYGGYTEGWATYVEMLSYNYAGLETDVAQFLQYNKDFSLSLYATSDIGIHYYGWDFNKLCDFWKQYGITDTDGIKEVQKLILAAPGNYLKYYVGYLQITDLKNSQKEYLGNDYSDKSFHEKILKIGPAPFHIIEKYINNPDI